MTKIAKYNIFKGVSTVITVGTPILSLVSCSELFAHRSDTAISAAGVFALIFALWFLKDKLAENFKLPSPFIASLVGLILIVMVENIIYPMKVVFLSTMITTGIDSLTFKRIYQELEKVLPDAAKTFKKFGFIFVKEKDLIGD